MKLLYLTNRVFDFTIQKGYISSVLLPSDAKFVSLFGPGLYSYGTAESSFSREIEITWQDTDGVTWSSCGDQTGSTFEITEVKQELTYYGVSVVVKSIFSCTLYGPQGKSKKLTNGVSVLRFYNNE